MSSTSTALSYLAGITQRIRLGLMVTGVPYRNPAVLANMVTTFDHFSGGRLELGLGMGWYDDEAIAYGMPLLPVAKRLTQFEEACGVLTRSFTEETVTHEGTYYQLADARMQPKPVQKPYPPIMIGGVGEKRMLRIVARFAQDWNYPGGTPEDFQHKVEVLHAHCADVGRDPAEIALSCHLFVQTEPSATAELAASFAALATADLRLDQLETVLAEEELRAHEKARRSEHAAFDRVLGVRDQLGLDLRLHDSSENRVGVEVSVDERLPEHVRIVHLEPVRPHRAEHRVGVCGKEAVSTRQHGPTHQL